MPKGNQTYKPPAPDKPEHPVWSHLMDLFLLNFSYILLFIPSLVWLYLLLAAGGWPAFVGFLVFLIPAGPAVAAMFDMGYQYAREIPKFQQRSFWTSYKANFRQGCATMAVLLLPLAALLLPMFAQGERPWFVVVCLILGLLALLEFAILAFSQVALVNLPLKKIWKNALFLIPVMGWRGLGVAALHLLFLAALYQWISVMFLLFLFLGPATLVAWTSWKLFPKLEGALLRHE